MKITKTDRVILAAAVVFAVFTAGYFIGRHNVAGSFVVETQRVADAVQSETPTVSAVQPSSAEAEEAAETAAPAEETESAAAVGTEKIDINTADAALLETLPGIGVKRAQGIIAYREEHGRFQYVEQIVEVPGIGEAIWKGMEDLITVGQEGAS